MAYKKFDDATEQVSQGTRTAYQAIPWEAVRRTIQSVSNRVIGHTAGTGGMVTAGLGTGSTSGVQITNTLKVVINGTMSTCIAQDNLWMPGYGTMGTRKCAKFLVSTGNGTSGTITGPGNVVQANDYANDNLALAACKLPDLPDGHCALGYFSIIAPRATAAVINSKSVIGLYSTAGTAAFTDLICMPYDA